MATGLTATKVGLRPTRLAGDAGPASDCRRRLELFSRGLGSRNGKGRRRPATGSGLADWHAVPDRLAATSKVVYSSKLAAGTATGRRRKQGVLAC